jgi:two-component system, OmpR family, phosphate regulon response regulator PhoB
VINCNDALVPAPRVLVVEDDENLVLLMRYNLECCGYAVDTIDCGSAADAFLIANRPALVILDWMLPALSGIEVLRRLRSRSGIGYVPVIMLTARSEREARLRAVGSGVDAFLSKPFSLRELIEQAERLLRPGTHDMTNVGVAS